MFIIEAVPVFIRRGDARGKNLGNPYGKNIRHFFIMKVTVVLTDDIIYRCPERGRHIIGNKEIAAFPIHQEKGLVRQFHEGVVEIFHFPS